MFKKYNIRDVETEMGIQQRLAKFPVPAQSWDEYHLDQKINDRGVRLDIDLVAAAIEMDTRSRKELTDTMKTITELENPNSVQQMKAWLSDNGLETDTLGLGGVWFGIAPVEERMEEVHRLLGLPENVKVFSMFALGYPAETRPQHDRFDPERNHIIEK